MIGFNHALVGALIGKVLPLPLALPVAIASHFVLDALPHYGLPHKQRDRSKVWKIVFTIDFFATAALIIPAVATHHYAMLACGVAAVLPDFVWVGKFIKNKSFDMSNTGNWYTKWHAGIQHYERPWGVWVELSLVCVLSYVFYVALQN